MTDFLWTQSYQLALLGLLILPLTRWLGKRHPHFAILCCYLLIAKALLPPTLGHEMSLFHWLENRTSIPSNKSAIDLFAKSRDAAVATSSLEHVNSETHLSQTPLATAQSQTSETTSITGLPLTLPIMAPSVSVNRNPQLGPEQIIGAIWISGIIVLLLVTAKRHQQFRRLLKNAEPVRSETCTMLLAELKTSLHVKRPISMKCLDEFTIPAVLGWRRPMILLPKKLLREDSKDDLKSILAHELIHIKRSDSTLSIFQFIAQLIWWFHPTIWLTNRGINRLRELCCDGEVLHLTQIENSTYAQALLNIAKQRMSARLPNYIPSARPSEITAQRIENLMKKPNQLTHKTPLCGWATAILLIAFVLPNAEIISEINEQETHHSTAKEQGNRPHEHTTSPATVSPPNEAKETIAPPTSSPQPFPPLRDFSRSSRRISAQSIYEVHRDDLVTFNKSKSGTVIPRSQIKIQTLTDGTITKVNLTPGRLVKKGDLLLELSNSELMRSLRNAELNLKQAKAELRQRTLKAQQVTLEHNAKLHAAQQQIETAAAEQSRKESLFEKSLISQEVFTKSRTALNQAEQNLLLLDQTQSLQARQQEQERELANLDIERASLVFETTLSQCQGLKLRSPITGIIALARSSQSLKEGTYIKSGTSIADIFDPNAVSVKAHYPAEEIGDISVGSECAIAINGIILPGQITAINPIITYNQSVSIFIELPSEQELIKRIIPGSRANIAFGIKTLTDSLIISLPESGPQETGRYPAYLLAKDGVTARPTAINLQAIGWDSAGRTRVAVEGDLREGDKLIIEQHHFRARHSSDSDTMIRFLDN